MPTVPFKLNQDRRHHIPRQRHKVANWREYDASLRQRGSVTVWFTEEAVAAWAAEPRTTRGGQPWYSALAILTAGPVASFTADGAYDRDRVYAGVAARHPEAAVVVPPRATAVPSGTAEGEPTRRDRHLRHIAEHGRMAWQTASGYTRRARAEAAIGRWKQVIGDGLRAHADQRRATEVDVAVHALNRMLEFGRPSYVRTA